MTGGSQYIVASRRGIFLVDHDGHRQIAPGYFFGVTIQAGDLYCFRTVASPEARDNPDSGSIVRYQYRDGALGGPDILVEGLDYNCHQVDFFDGSFWVVDSGRQRVLEYDSGWRLVAEHRIGPEAARRGPDDPHVNSFLGRGDRIWLMFHNAYRGRPSEIVECDRCFREIGRTILPSSACHDLVALEDGSLLYCESSKGRIASPGGHAHMIDSLYTRGLAVGTDEIAVGSSLYGARTARGLLPGFVTFLDRDYNRIARIHLPAAPTQIRRLDGADLSLSQPR